MHKDLSTLQVGLKLAQDRQAWRQLIATVRTWLGPSPNWHASVIITIIMYSRVCSMISNQVGQDNQHPHVCWLICLDKSRVHIVVGEVREVGGRGGGMSCLHSEGQLHVDICTDRVVLAFSQLQ